MLKAIIFIYSIINTLGKGVDLIYIYSLNQTNLPTVIIVLQCISVALGLYLIFKRIINRLLLRELMLYCLVILGFTAFGLVYVPQVVILELALHEKLLVGTVLDIIITLVFLYYSGKDVRSTFQYIERESKKQGGRKKK